MNEDQLILDLVANRDLDTQSALLDALKDSGLNMTQPVLSRLLRKLGVRKIGGYYRPPAPNRPAFPNLKYFLSPPNLIVIKTLPGHANALAYHLDALKLRAVAGSVAGDDTVMVAIAKGSKIGEVHEMLRRIFEGDGRPE
ncbi:Arginine repressor [Sulfidibacter corallicola]|uniref:Arginine repressor n=1 Tax=Sulfidibacter corallicola TaxID=2818388 RepID=A0A8A4TLG8_SULCO|nr:hypothetical protein [Sulfidibacter corallicola]QTD50317.1 hypothetical protein J3U87_32435 [Sulfidibacter corallicola]